MSEPICIKCGNIREKGRKLCRECYLEFKRHKEKNRYLQQGRYNYGKSVCLICKSNITLWRKTQRFCKKCGANTGTTSSVIKRATNNYQMIGNRTAQNVIAESVLKRKLKSNEIVHHLDENPANNNAINLIVINRDTHGKLHFYLRIQRVILEQSNNENLENCWDTLRVPLTTAWLETTNANVIKLWEIGQSAAEPLNSKEHEEGSETMHQTSQVDEDIVQTTT